jgi:AcrR family transcriptional regulator
MRRNTDRSLDHEQLVAAAVSLTFDDGLHALTHAALAVRSGATPKAVHQLYPDLAPLVAETFDRIAGAELAEVKRLVLANPSPVRQLQVLLETLAEPVRAEVDAVWLESWSLGRRNPALGAAVREQEGAWHTLVAAVLRRGIKAGDFLPVDADDVAAQILAVIDGVNAYALVGYRSDLDRMRLLTAIARAQLGVRFDEPLAPTQPRAQVDADAEARASAQPAAHGLALPVE